MLVAGLDRDWVVLHPAELFFELLHRGVALHVGNVHAADGDGPRHLALVGDHVDGVRDARDDEKAHQNAEGDSPAPRAAGLLPAVSVVSVRGVADSLVIHSKDSIRSTTVSTSRLALSVSR